MSLPISGAIQFSDINTELGRTATAQLSINDSELRTLFGQASGAVDLNSGYGKSYRMTITPGSWNWYAQPSDNDFYPSYGYVDPLVSYLPWWQSQTGGNQGQTPAGGKGSITSQSIPNTTYKLRAMWDRVDGGLGEYPLYMIVSDLSAPPDVNWVNVDTYGYPYGSGTDLPAYELASGYIAGVGYWKAYGLSSPNYDTYITLGQPKGVNSINAASHRLVTSSRYGDQYGTYLEGPTGFWFYSNGTSTIGNWSSPTTAGIGSQYEIYFGDKGSVWDLQDSNNQPLAFATWLPLTNGVQIYALYGGWGQTTFYQIRKAGTNYPFVSGDIQLGV